MTIPTLTNHLTTTNPAEHWFWTRPRPTRNPTKSRFRTCPKTGARIPFSRTYLEPVRGYAHLSPAERPKAPVVRTYTPSSTPIDPTLYFQSGRYPAYRLAMHLYRAGEFPHVNILGKPYPKLHRCRAKHPEFGQCMNPFCVSNPFQQLHHTPTSTNAPSDALVDALYDFAASLTPFDAQALCAAFPDDLWAIKHPDFLGSIPTAWEAAIRAHLNLSP